jgi:hypothetical protein
MKKLLVITFVVLLLIGCKTVNVYHKTESEEELSRFTMTNTLSVSEFDGEKVFWGLTEFRPLIVNCQPGTHTITANYSYYNGLYTINVSDLKKEFDFIAGKNYILYPDSDRKRYYLEIKELTKGGRFSNFLKYFN